MSETPNLQKMYSCMLILRFRAGSRQILFHSWNTLPDPNLSPPRSEVGLVDLFSEIRATVDTEAQIVKAVFPNPPVVMQVFLQRVFAQSVRVLQYQHI